IFIADNSMYRLVCWVGFLSLKEKKIFLSRRGLHHSEPNPNSNRALDIVTDAAVTQWELASNGQRNAFCRRETRPQADRSRSGWILRSVGGITRCNDSRPPSLLSNFYPFPPYCASLTCSIQSTTSPSSAS